MPVTGHQEMKLVCSLVLASFTQHSIAEIHKCYCIISLFFLLPYIVPFSEYATVYLFIPFLANIWLFFHLGPIFLQKQLCICDPAIPLLGIYLKKTIIQEDTCTPVFIAALFTIAKTWKRSKYPLAEEQIRKMWYIYAMEYYLAITTNEIMPFTATWRSGKYCMILLLWDFPCDSAGKESACNVGDLGLIPELGRSPGEGKGYLLQYSGLENSVDYTVLGVTKSRIRLSNFHLLLREIEKEMIQRNLFAKQKQTHRGRE